MDVASLDTSVYIRALGTCTIVLALFLSFGFAVLSIVRRVERALRHKCSARHRRRARACHATVLVQGDFARSPRMQYHVQSLLQHSCATVDVVASADSQLPVALEVARARGALRILSVRGAPGEKAARRRLPSLLYYALFVPLKVFAQCATMAWQMMVQARTSDIVFVQNPPAVPAVLIGRLAAWAHGGSLVVDWHNLGYTILALSLGERSAFVRVYRALERFGGRLADKHICVTRALRLWLEEQWGIDAAVLHDRPAAVFRPTTPRAWCELLRRLADAGAPLRFAHSGNNAECEFTRESEKGEVALREDRPALVVSSTSWTKDEDFSILFDALQSYDRLAQKDRALPRVTCVVTGKGPERAMYEKRIAATKLSRVRILTLWLAAEDYPVLLGAADVGVSLHYSSSALDLPMKVVDMFGAGLPVCAIDFACLDELVQNDVNGLVFTDAASLCHSFVRLLKGYPEHSALLERLRGGALVFRRNAWDENWLANAAPVLLS